MSNPRPQHARAALAPAALAALLALPACVTEPRRPGRSPAPSASDSAARSGDRPALPPGPIATPAGVTTTARLNCRMLPLGVVTYDGQVLPVVSPDGNFLAVEQGDAPTWPTLLARPDAAPSPGTRLAAYDLRQAPARELVPAEPPPRGSILGRACDTRGYLIEWPRPDGSRWLGRIGWVGGKVEWFALGTAINAHAVIAADGTLAYTRRAPAADARAELVVRHPDGGEAVFAPADGDCAFPAFAPGGRVVCTLVLSPAGLEILALRVRHADGTRVNALGPPLSRRTLTTATDATQSYQVFAGADLSPVRPGAEPAGAAEALLLFNPSAGRMAAFWWRDGTLLPLADRSIAAAHSAQIDPPGFVQTTPDGLMFSVMPKDLSSPVTPVRLMEASYVPRATTGADRPLILIGPATKRDPTRLSVVAMTVLPPEPAPSPASAR